MAIYVYEFIAFLFVTVNFLIVGCNQTDQQMIKVKEYVKEDLHITTVSGFVRPFGVKFIQTGGILVADFGNNSVVRLSKTTITDDWQ